MTSGGLTNQGVLFHTTDAGQTWQRVALPGPLAKAFSFTEHLFYFQFLNDQVGWISLQPDHSFWYTNNGGQTWHNLTLPSATTQWGSITFFDATTWVFTTAAEGSSLTTSNGQPIIYVTHDAGATWLQKVLPVPAGLSFSTPMEDAQSFSASDGILSVADGGEDILIYSTHDGGDSWQFTAPLSPDIIHRVYELGLPTFYSMNDGYFYAGPYPIYGKLPSPNYLITTHDGGQTWQVMTARRYPISEILAQTRQIPAGFQWGIFLRNHDELTLEMVTDDERDYMYAEYAKDPG